MTDKVIENNQVTIMGTIVSGFTYSHEIFGEGFYMTGVKVERLSESADMIPMMISERLVDVTKDYTGENVVVSGQFRSYNRHEERKNRLVLSVFARELEFVDQIAESAKPIRSFWMAISARNRSTARHRLGEKSRIFCWRSIAPMANQIISHVSAGEEMQDMPVALLWETDVHYGAESRAVNI